MREPRQVGKTTTVLQALERPQRPSHFASADEPLVQRTEWIRQQWESGRQLARTEAAVLVLDEIQKIASWSETVKALWDEDTRLKRPLHVVLLGSSPL